MIRGISKTSSLILIFTFLSCVKSFNEDSILGTWYSVEQKVNGGESNPKTNFELTLGINNSATFKVDNASRKVDYSFSSIDPERKVIVLDMNIEGRITPMFFTLSNDTLFMKYNNSGDELILTLLKK